MVSFWNFRYISDNLPSESPVLYGLHPNAEIGFLTTTSETLFKTVFELQPRESGSSGGPVTTREDKIKALVDDVMEKLPEAFNMGEIMGKVEERTPYVVVAFQVDTKYTLMACQPLHDSCFTLKYF